MMTKFLRNLSIYRKLLSILLFASVTSIVFAGILLMLLEISAFRHNIRDELAVFANIIGNRSTAALLYGDKKLAEENLAGLLTLPVVKVSCFYDQQGIAFAQMHKNDGAHWDCPASIETVQTHFEAMHLIIVEAIAIDGSSVGSVYIHADLSSGYWQKVKFCGLVFLVLVGVSIFSFLLSTPFLKLISEPLEKLLTTVNLISDTQDFSLRAKKVHNDELGVLVTAFNTLIATVESQNNALTQSKNRYLALFDDNPTMVFNLDEHGIILSVNHTGAKHLSTSVRDLLKHSIFDFVHIDDLPHFQALLDDCLRSPLQVHKRDFRQLCFNDQIIWVRATCKTILNEQGQSSFLLVCEDITEARILSEKIAYQANHDALTGLSNRSQFERHIKQAVLSAKAKNLQHVLCFLDLDRFKIVNDTCGHLAGDELLRQLGDLFMKNIRKHDVVARLGGDEFGILMHDCALNEAFTISEKLRDVVQDFHFAWDDRRFTVGVSIGITAITMTSSGAANILKEADTACYAAKDKGRNRVHVYRPDDEMLALRKGEMQWVERIQQGLAQNRFCLYGQPIVAIGHKEEGLHFETLIRYRDDSGRIIPPGAFLPAAERYGLASVLDRWVIRQLFEWIAKKTGFLEKLAVCSVNLSGVSLSDETMLSFIYEQFDTWKIPPHKICFEVTETAAIANLSYATNFIHQLQYKGCLFSLDDFGSGLSSFAYLKNLPVDFLKIDGLFVKDILEDKVDLAMVRSINEVGHVMGKKTVAEFVENEKTFNVLKSLGVDYAQGYGIGKPMPLHELTVIKPFAVLQQ
jgi:diguanylate cyclase (GGDEF)-like protein/PAS domain S-box-containing protein